MGTRCYSCVWQFFTMFAAVCGQADVELSEMNAVMADAVVAKLSQFSVQDVGVNQM